MWKLPKGPWCEHAENLPSFSSWEPGRWLPAPALPSASSVTLADLKCLEPQCTHVEKDRVHFPPVKNQLHIS